MPLVLDCSLSVMLSSDRAVAIVTVGSVFIVLLFSFFGGGRN